MSANGTEVAIRRPQGSALPAKLEYAHELANSGLLPAAFRGKPANVLWAMEYADMLGLPPMVAMTGIHVIEGKPTASAGLISGLVRKARHKLRVTGDDKRAVAEITRCDDPDFTFRSEWTLERARQAELTGKSNWKKYPAAMLKARAITEVARDACEEALYGLQYTPEELGAEVDEDGVVVGEIVDEPAPARQEQRDPAALEWLAKAVDAAPGHATLDECKADWQAGVKFVNDGKLTRDDVAPLQDLLRVRIKALQDSDQPEEAEIVEDGITGLDADDPWAEKIAGIPDGDDAEAERVLAELVEAVGSGEMDAGHFTRAEAALVARFPTFGGAGQAAA